MEPKRIQRVAEFKALGDAGTFTGYAAVFGNIDGGGDIIERDAFKEFSTNRDGMVKVLWQHRSAEIIGLAAVRQDDKGLAFQGQLILEVPRAREAYALMKASALDGMSIGYDVLPGGAEVMTSGVRKLKHMKLWEISPVTWGMNPLAGIDGVKSAEEFSDIRDFEDYLRDAGFSRAEAKRKASEEFKHKGQRDVAGQVLQLCDFIKSKPILPQRDVAQELKATADMIRKFAIR